VNGPDYVERFKQAVGVVLASAAVNPYIPCVSCALVEATRRLSLTNLSLDLVRMQPPEQVPVKAFQRLLLPSLQHFEFSGEPTEWTSLSSIVHGGCLPILALGRHSACFPMPLTRFQQLLEETPSLTSLTAPGIYLAKILTGMACGEPLPHLTTLTCLMWHRCSLMRNNFLDDLNLFCDMLEKRRSNTNPAASVTDLTFVSNSRFSQVFQASGRVKRLLREGWNINWKTRKRGNLIGKVWEQKGMSFKLYP